MKPAIRWISIVLMGVFCASCECGTGMCDTWVEPGRSYDIELVESLGATAGMPCGTDADRDPELPDLPLDLQAGDSFRLSVDSRGFLQKSPHNCEYDCFVGEGTVDIDGVEFIDPVADGPSGVVDARARRGDCEGLYTLKVRENKSTPTNYYLQRQWESEPECGGSCADRWSIRVVDDEGRQLSVSP